MEHQLEREEMDIYRATDHALVQITMTAVQPTFYEILNNHEDGYADLTFIDLYDHIDTHYGSITEEDLDHNTQKLHAK